MSFYHLPHPWDPGYAIPDYVMAEPPGRGTLTTRWIPRGTISQLVPDYLMKPATGTELLGRPDVNLGDTEVYELEPIGDVSQMKPGSAGDPIAAYGQRAAEWILDTIGMVPPEDRLQALQVLLDSINPALFTRAEKAAQKLVAQGAAPSDAYQRALAGVLSGGMVQELVKAGRSGQVAARGQLALGVYAHGPSVAYEDALGIFGGIKKAVSSAVRTVSKPVRSVARKAAPIAAMVVASPLAAQAYLARKPAKAVGTHAWRGAQQAGKWVGKGIEKLGSLACGLARSPVAPMAAAGGAAAMGQPPSTGAMGAQVAQAVCAQEEVVPTPPEVLEKKELPSWLVPAAIGGGGLLLLLALQKKKG